MLSCVFISPAYAKRIKHSTKYRNKHYTKHIVAVGPNDEALKLVNAADVSDDMNKILMQSISLIGVPYKWGGNSPSRGLDCSGFIHYVYQKSLGIDLPRTSAEMAKLGKTISIDELKPGDLLFFNHNGYGNRITHVGIYLGDNKFIHSTHRGGNIEISDLNENYYHRFVVAKRFLS